MEINETEDLFIDSVRNYLNGIKTEPHTEMSDEDWLHLFKLANQQMLFPVVYESLYSSSAATDSKIVSGYKKAVVSSAGSQAIRTSLFLNVYSSLIERGFRPLVVKGIICRSLWEKGYMRSSSDEDILVSDIEWDGVLDAIVEMGFTPLENDRSRTEISMKRGVLCIEVHRRLFDADSLAFADMEKVFVKSFLSAKYYLTENGAKVFSLSPSDHFIYLVFHAYKHFVHSGFGIRQIIDIGLWAEKYGNSIDCDYILSKCENLKISEFIATVLKTAEFCIGRKIPLSDVFITELDFKPMLHDLLCGGIYGSNDLSRLHSATLTLSAVENEKTGKKTGILKSVFPPKKQLSEKYPVLKKHPVLLPVMWFRRIISYIGEIGKKGSSVDRTLEIADERRELLRYYGIIK